jgi:hypothetical protein
MPAFLLVWSCRSKSLHRFGSEETLQQALACRAACAENNTLMNVHCARGGVKDAVGPHDRIEA